MTLEQQIKQRWGQYGDWQSAGHDQVAALALLMRQNGIEDLGQFKLKSRDYTLPAGQYETTGDAGGQMVDYGESKGRAIDAFYGDRQLSFLGDINDDGSYSSKAGVYDEQGDKGRMAWTDYGTPMLGWSSQGHGNTSFGLFEGPDGEPIVVPMWGSSSTQTYQDIRAIASIAALAAGGYYAGAGGTTGAAAQGALQGYGTAVGGNMLANPNGDVDSLATSSLAGAATGAFTGGVKAYGADQGWNPAVTRAATAGGKTLLQGGGADDALKSAALSGITTGGGSLMPASFDAGGGSGSDLAGNNVAQLSGASNVNDFDYQWLQDQISGSNLGTEPWIGTDYWDSAGNMDPYGPGSNWGQDTTTNMGLGSGTFDWAKLMKALGGPAGIAALAGGIGGILDGGDKTQTMSTAPWEPAQAFMKKQIDRGSELSDRYASNPFSEAQKTAYGNVGGILDLLNYQAPGLLGGFNASARGENQFVRGGPNRLTGASGVAGGPTWNPGLLGAFGSRG